MQWWTVEVLDAPGAPATSWQASYGQVLVEVAVTQRVQAWDWVVRPWGVVLELAFLDEADWLRFRAVPAVRASLDAVPDPVHGLLLYPGRGGGSGAAVPRRPRPAPLRGGAAVPEPEPAPERPEEWLGPQRALVAS